MKMILEDGKTFRALGLEKSNMVKIDISTEVIYRFNANLIFHRNKTNLKFMGKHRRPPSSQNNLRRTVVLDRPQSHHRAMPHSSSTVTKHTDPWDSVEGSSVDAHICSCLILQ